MDRVTSDALAATRVVMPFAMALLAGGLHRSGAPGAVLVASGWLLAALTLRRGTTRDRAAAAGAGMASGALLAVLAQLPLAPNHVARLAQPGVVAVEGSVLQSDATDTRIALTVRAEHTQSRRRTGAVTGLLGVTIAHATQRWPVGSRVRLVGRVRRPRSFEDPGAYDLEATLARRGIRATMFFWNDEAVSLLAPPPADADPIDRLRTALAARIGARTTEPVRGYLTAVLLGATQSLDRETRTALTRTGLAHVVSVSGFHVAVAAGACVVAIHWLVLRFGTLALRVDAMKLAASLSVVPVAGYAALAGGSVPAARSFLTWGVLFAALACGRPPDGLRALAGAAILLALPAPDIAADVSFELSFASVAALLLALGREHTRASGTTRPAARWLRQLVVAPLVTSIVATLATAPLTAWHFQQVSLIAPLANLVALPLLGPATLLPGLAALPLFAVAPRAADVLLAIAAFGAAGGLAIATRLGAYRWAAVATPMPNLFEVTLCYAALALWWHRPNGTGTLSARTRWRAGAAIVALLVLADTAYWYRERFLDPTLRVTFLSVGQGDAAVVELPYGRVLVIDGGGFPGDFDPGERLIAPFLRARKIHHVDALVLSHPQLDHFGGLASLAAQFTPDELWSNGTRATGPRYAHFEAALAAAGTRTIVLRRGTLQRLAPDVDVEVLHPDRVDGVSVNDTSLVLRLRYGRTAVLFTGDIEHGAERSLLNEAPRLASDVLKVPHHGSATSSTAPWLAAIAPRIAVVSSGADNRFGFPAPAVVRRLRALGAAVWNTAEDGAVRVDSDGNHVSARALRPERFVFPRSLW